jgi:hypothetical protein
MLMVVLEILVAYLIVLYTSRKNIGWLLSGYAFFALIFLQIERMTNDYGGYHLGVATSFMVQCTHLCTFAWDYADGTIPEEKRSSEQKKYAIDKCPSIIEFFAAAFNPPQSFSGPSSNFMDFKNCIFRVGDFANIPSTLIPTLIRLSAGLGWCLFFVIANTYFPTNILYSSFFTDANLCVKVRCS